MPAKRRPGAGKGRQSTLEETGKPEEAPAPPPISEAGPALEAAKTARAGPAGEAARTGPAGPAELGSDFARQFWEMKVDAEAFRNYYVIHEHLSRRPHWDLRLEKEGVLKSWAVPREPPAVENVKRLAVAVEDHPLGYGTFEGEIPAENYGAGRVRIWDRGTYEPLDIKEGKWVFRLAGKRLTGKYCLIRLKPRPGEKSANWLFFKAKE
jgi:bifunctional non-homologous end joining protein LigD